MCQITCLLVWAGNSNFLLSIVIWHMFLSPIEPSASSNLFCPHSNLFDCIQYFLNVLKYFWPCSNMQIFKVKPSSIYSWSIGHILEHEFFCLGRLGSSGRKEKKVDLSYSEQLLRVVFSWAKKNLKFFLPTKSWKNHPQKLLRKTQIHFFLLAALCCPNGQNRRIHVPNCGL